MKKLMILSALFLSFGLVRSASAHVVVKPNEAGVGTFQTFTVAVPVEKNIGTVGLHLNIPGGLTYVSPNVKPGWIINITKSGTGDDAVVTGIDWTGGFIPVGERDDFIFSAKVPSATTTLVWKANQVYADGSVVSWTHDPSENITDFSTAGPYSQTKIVNDLSASTSAQTKGSTSSFTFSLLALVFSLIALGVARQKKN